MKLRYNAKSHSYWLDNKRLRGASSVAKVPDDTYHLTQWKLRTALLGAATHPHILTAAAADHDDKAKMDDVVEEAIRLGKGTTGRDYGTAVHRVIERINMGGTLLETPEIAKLTEQWHTLLEANGLQVVATEGAVVHPELKVAGRFDVKVVDLATGKTHIGDVKTGVDADRYLHAHAVQLHLYASAPLLARGVPVGDVDFETTEFDEQTGVDQEVGFVFHLPAEGEPSVIPVDIAAGAWCVEHVIQPIWQWRARKDLRATMTAPATPKRIEPLTVVAAPTPPDEGPEATEEVVAPFRTRYQACADGKKWIGELERDALQAHCSFHLSGAKTLRRLRIMEGLVVLAEADAMDDDLVKALVREVTGDNAMTWTAVTAGACVGSLNAVDAATFVAACELWVAQVRPLVHDEHGPRLGEAA